MSETTIDAIRERLEAGMYRETRIQRYFVRCDADAQAKGLPYYGVWVTATEEFIPTVRFSASWEAEREADRMNREEGPIVIDVEADIRALLAHIDRVQVAPTGA